MRFLHRPNHYTRQDTATNYYYQYSSDSGSTWSTATLTGSTSTSKTVTGLTNGTSYIFRVAAVNSIGTGSYSSNSASTTPQGISIDVQPVGGLDYCGNGLSVTASGAANLSYQWQYVDEYGVWVLRFALCSAVTFTWCGGCALQCHASDMQVTCK